MRDIRSHSAVLQWRPVLSEDLGSYELSYAPNGTTESVSIESEIKLIISGNFSWTELNNLQPDTIYTARLIPKSNIYNIVKTLTFRTLPGEELLHLLFTSVLNDLLRSEHRMCCLSLPLERFGPATVMVSDLGPDRLRVRWNPVQPQQVQQYRVEYGAIPSGLTNTVTLPSNQGTALLKRLQRHTEYLITVTALHSSGQQRAMSIKACTQESTAN